MQKIHRIFIVIVLGFVLLLSGSPGHAQAADKVFCDEVIEPPGRNPYCNKVYADIHEWLSANQIDSRFSMAEGLSYAEGVWTYLNWPIQIVFTDATWQNETVTKYGNAIQRKELEAADIDRDLLPNKIETINQFAVEAIEREVFELGFEHPARTRNKFIIIRVEDGGWNDSELPKGALGRAWVDDLGFPIMAINPAVGTATLDKTIAHELFHLIQFTYNPDFQDRAEELNFSEATALWMERLLFEFEKYRYKKDYTDFISAYYKTPQRSLYGTNPVEKNFQYGTVIWPIFLEMQFKKGIIKDIWKAYFDRTKSSGNFSHALYFATDQALKNKESSIEKAYRHFAQWAFDKGQYRRDASDYPEVRFLYSVEQYPTTWMLSDDTADYPSILGTTYITFDTRPSLSPAGEDFIIDFRSNPDALWAIDLYASTGDQNRYLGESSISIPMGSKQDHRIIIPATKLQNRVVLMASVLYGKQLENTDSAFSYSYPFAFRAGFEGSLGNGSQAPTMMEATPKVKGEQSGDLIFPDIPATHKYYITTRYLQDRGVIQGYPDGTFKPHNTINRAELLKILIGDTVPSNMIYANCFPDVHEEWFASYVCYAHSQGFIQGYPDGTFRPAQTVNRAEAIKMALEIFRIPMTESSEPPYTDTPASAWFTPYVAAAKDAGVLDESWTRFQPGTGMKRGVMSDILYWLLTP